MTTIATAADSRSLLLQVASDFSTNQLQKGLDAVAQLPNEIRHTLHKLFHEAHGYPDTPRYGQQFEDSERSTCQERSKIVNFYISNYLFGSALDTAKTEFTELQHESSLVDAKIHQTIGAKPENAPNNQWYITPYDKTLVPLDSGKYINANYLFGKFILTQSPVEKSSETSSPAETRPQFWEMVDQHNVQVIIMLNGEPGTYYSPYFPHTEDATVTLDKKTISLEKSETFELDNLNPMARNSITVRTLKFQSKDSERTIFHIKANNWNDFTPGSQNTVFKIIELVNQYQNECQAPIVIHCRAGVGRAGQFATVFHITENIRLEHEVNVKESVQALRSPATGRHPNMIQHLEQYLAVHAIANKLTGI